MPAVEGWKSVGRIFTSAIGVPLLCLLSLFSASPCCADQAIGPVDSSEVALVMQDASGRLTIDEISSLPYQSLFTPFQHEAANPGYSDAAIWYRITPGPGEWLLEVTYPHLDVVNLYRPKPDGGYHVSQAGDRLPFTSREISYHHPLFRLEPTGNKDFYLEIRASGSVQTAFRLWRPEEFNEHRALDQSVAGIFFGALSVMALYNLFLFFATKDRSYLFYIGFICAYLAFQSSMSGYSFQYLWPESVYWTNKSIPFLLGLAVAAAVQFCRHFLATWQTLPRLDKAMRAVIGAGLLSMPLVFLLPYGWSAIYANLVGVALAIVVIPAACIALYRGFLPARFFVTAWTVFLVGTFVYALMLAGLLPQNSFTAYAMPAGSLVEVVLLSLALADRINNLRRESEQQQLQFSVELQQLNATLELKVQQRTRELQNAKEETDRVNFQLARKNQTLEQMAHRDALTGLLNRRAFWEEAEIMLADGERNGYPISVVMLDLDHFKQINDKYGHQFGDKVLCEIGNILRHMSRKSDRAARYGGEEFILLLSHADGPAAMNRADRLLQTISSHDFGKPIEPQLTTSIGTASTTTGVWELERLISIADRALYKAKQEGRNRACG